MNSRLETALALLIMFALAGLFLFGFLLTTQESRIQQIIGIICIGIVVLVGLVASLGGDADGGWGCVAGMAVFCFFCILILATVFITACLLGRV